MNSMITCSSSQNTCVICLEPLLEHEEHDNNTNGWLLEDYNNNNGIVDNISLHDNFDNDDRESPNNKKDIGAVFGCGHVFHVKCWNQWAEKRCPCCNQDARLFTKLYISAPPLPRWHQRPRDSKDEPALPPVVVATEPAHDDDNNEVPASQLSHLSKQKSSFGLDNEEEEEEQRQILLDMRTTEQAGPAQTIRTVVSLKSKMRKLRCDSESTESELELTRIALEMTQEDLELANRERVQQSEEIDRLKGKLARLSAQHWERHNILHAELVDQHERETRALKRELDDVKMQLTLRNRQLAHWAKNYHVVLRPPPRPEQPPQQQAYREHPSVIEI